MHDETQRLQTWTRHRRSLWASRGGLVWDLANGALARVLREISHAGAQHVLVEPEASDELLNVLIAHQFTRMLGQDVHRYLCGARSTLSSREVRALENPIEAES
jgi:hypothetical protein